MLKAISQINHDGQIYEAGDVLPSMTEKQEKQLVDGGIAESTSKSEQKRVETMKGSQPEANPNEEKPTERWNKAKLSEYAAAHGVEVNETMTRSEMFSKLTGVDATEIAPAKDEDKDDIDADGNVISPETG